MTNSNIQIISAGYNEYGQLGREGDNHIPALVENLKTDKLVSVSIGSDHSVALYEDGSVFGWGWNESGLLGFPKEDEKVKFPTKINGLPNIIDVKCVSDVILFLTEEKKVFITSTKNKKSLFEEIKIGESAVALFGFKDPWIVGESGVVYWYDCEKSKRIKKIGSFQFGAPKQILSIKHSVILITSTGEALGMSMKKLRPNDVDENSDVVGMSEDHFSPIESLRDVKIKKVSGSYCYFLALSEDNQVFAWGSNRYGQLGVGTKKDMYNSFVPLTVCGDVKIIDIAAGYFHSILVDCYGHVWGLGDGEYGQTMLGDEEGIQSKLIEGAVSAYCGEDFSLVIIGNLPLSEGEALNFIDTHSTKGETMNDLNKSQTELLKDENIRLKNEISLKEKQIDELENELSKSKDEVKMLNEKIHSLHKIKHKYKKMKHNNKTQNSIISKLEKQIEDLKIHINNRMETEKLNEQNLLTNSTKIKIYSQEDIENLDKIEKIGRGATSDVIKVSRKEIYALKVLEFDSTTDNDNLSFKLMKDFVKEFEIMSQISHQNILKTYGICYGDSTHSPSILLEYCPTNLKKIISNLADENEIKHIIFEIISGMSYLHQAGFIHRDLKPENILIDSENHVKICDFGISTISSETTHTKGIGTLAYMSPEILNEEEHYTEKVDVYSFGIVLYFILTKGSLPKLPITKIIQGSKIPIPPNINDFYRDILEQCLSFEPKNRPSFSDLVNKFCSNCRIQSL